jgi:hypothetical protein
MYSSLTVLVIALVISLLFVNIYFRVKVLKQYKKLVKADVEFDLSHVLSKEKLRKEVLPKYPESESAILSFIRHIRFSTRIAMALFALISFFGWVLMHYR